MRTSNSIKNSITGAFSSFVNILVSFFTQKLFIIILGVEFQGLNGLFTNILSLLSIAELGIGEAIIFNMYKPIQNNDKETIKSLMKFYSKTYWIITAVILGAGLALTPFIGSFVGEKTVDINLTFVYLLFLMQTVASYVLTYKRSILYASQKNYVINIIHILYIIALNAVQLLVLYLTKNYFLYLSIKIVFVLLENILINIYFNKHYSYLNEKKVNKLNKEISKDIFTRIKAMFFHKIGGFIINGTDNILISKLFGLTVVGLYSNYYLIINAVTTLFAQFISSTTASVGNLLIQKNDNKNFEVFTKIRFLNFYLAAFTGMCILVIMQSFITIWLGDSFLLPMAVLMVIVLNYYQKLMRKTYDSFMVAAGICVENRFIPLIESVVNIITSIILAKLFGLIGIFLGTVISGLTLWCYSYPKYMYKKILKRSYWNYAKETLGYILLFIALAITTLGISRIFVFDSNILQFIINLMISLIVPNVLLFIIFRKNKNFIYFKELVFKILNKIIHIVSKIIPFVKTASILFISLIVFI